MKKLLAISCALILSLSFASCGSKPEESVEPATEENTSAESVASEEVAPSAQQNTISIPNKFGVVDVPLNPQKVVVMDFGMLDTIDMLGATPELAVPANNLPQYLKKYEDTALNIGGLKDYDMEAIYGFEPDLIILGGRQEDSYDEFSAIAPTLYMGGDYSNYFEDSMKNIHEIGQIFQKESEADALTQTLQEKIEELQVFNATNGPKTLIILTNEGSMSVYGAGSRFGGLIHDTAGFPLADDTIEESTHGQEVNYEYLSKIDPDYIFVVDRTAAIGGDIEANETLNNDLVNGTKAAQNGKIILLSPDVWYLSGGGLQSLTIMTEELVSAIQ